MMPTLSHYQYKWQSCFFKCAHDYVDRFLIKIRTNRSYVTYFKFITFIQTFYWNKYAHEWHIPNLCNFIALSIKYLTSNAHVPSLNPLKQIHWNKYAHEWHIPNLCNFIALSIKYLTGNAHVPSLNPLKH